MTGREIIDVLERFSKLSWFRYSASNDPIQLKYPPVNVWRYDTDLMVNEDIKLVENMICDAVSSFQGNVIWVVFFSGRNWVLVPKRVKDLEDDGKYSVDTELLTILARDDPDFGLKANDDLPVLAKHIEGYLSQKGN